MTKLTTACPTCGAAVRVASDPEGEGTQYYEPVEYTKEIGVSHHDMSTPHGEESNTANYAWGESVLMRARGAQVLHRPHETQKRYSQYLELTYPPVWGF